MKKFLAVIMAAMFLCVGIGMVGCGESVVKPDIELRVLCYDYNGKYLGERRGEWVLSKEYDGKDHGVMLLSYHMENHPRWPNSWLACDVNADFNLCYQSRAKFACYDFEGNFTKNFEEKVRIPGVYVKEERISARDASPNGLVCWNERKYTVKVTVY